MRASPPRCFVLVLKQTLRDPCLRHLYTGRWCVMHPAGRRPEYVLVIADLYRVAAVCAGTLRYSVALGIQFAHQGVVLFCAKYLLAHHFTTPIHWRNA